MKECLGTKVWTNKSSILSTLKGPDPKYSLIPMITSQCQEQTECMYVKMYIFVQTPNVCRALERLATTEGLLAYEWLAQW